MKKLALLVSGFIFGFISLVHLYRFFDHFNVIIGQTEVPAWVSGLVFVVSGLLSLWMFASAKCGCCKCSCGCSSKK